MQKHSVGTEEFYVQIGRHIERMHLAVPPRFPHESELSYIHRLEALHAHWEDTGVHVVDDQETAASRADRQALETMVHFLKPERRNKPLLSTLRLKRQKYPRR